MDTEDFWRGNFGNNYNKRNLNLVENNYNMFSHICNKNLANKNINSIIEFGAGTGQNLIALKKIFLNTKFAAVEINKEAINELKNIQDLVIFENSIFDFIVGDYDLVLTKGLLIHIQPEMLQEAYKILYNCSRKYILICEYYNPTLIEINYRGNSGKLWKRDFAGEILDNYSDLELIDYGFVYHKDKFPQDDISWFLMKK
jgi:spore coat polysaccharide biosynthesis protein SpsF